jgi:uncharacterized protein YqjF (DUF2071 family)
MSAPWVLQMVWRDICFVHWRADGERLQRYLPRGVELDYHLGTAWLSVVPFRMIAIHARFAPILPGFADVAEINLRTYVRIGGVPGIWFFSLDADSPLVVRSARLTTGLPYFDARITTYEDDAGISYSTERTARGCVAGRFAARYSAAPVEHVLGPGSLEAFLHERYRFFAGRATRIVSGEIRHRPWSIGAITIDITHNTLGALVEHSLADEPDSAFFARKLDVRACAVRAGPRLVGYNR